jgi:hypothetical protein
VPAVVCARGMELTRSGLPARRPTCDTELAHGDRCGEALTRGGLHTTRSSHAVVGVWQSSPAAVDTRQSSPPAAALAHHPKRRELGEK